MMNEEKSVVRSIENFDISKKIVIRFFKQLSII